MSPFSLPVLIVAAGAVPAGFAAAWAARRLAEDIRPRNLPMIAASLILGLWATQVMPPGPLLAITCALGWALLVLGIVDVLAFRLPDILTLPLIATGVAVSLLLPDRDVIGHTIGAFAGLAFFYAIAEGYRLLRGREGLGVGDVKLAGAAGAWLGWEALPFVVLVACAMGLVWAGVAAVRRGREAIEERIPFGIALALAIWAIWLYGLPEVFDPAY
ncbi:MAG TPA: A24 family peptidase [Rhizomicrobium sp.]|nr:A24 family peptidase [Rhizomicrobium sp.]